VFGFAVERSVVAWAVERSSRPSDRHRVASDEPARNAMRRRPTLGSLTRV
jgi:hypothetical protein